MAETRIRNNQVSPIAAIDYSKLNLSNSVVNADINSAAAIAISKTALGTYTAWTSWTPSLTGLAYGGAGSAAYLYSQIGTTVFIKVSITLSTGYTWSTPTISLPVALGSISTIGHTRCLTVSIGEEWDAMLFLIEGTNIRFFNKLGASFASNPVAGTGGDWAFGGNNSNISFTGFYRTA
jgi:hypothetical protein